MHSSPSCLESLRSLVQPASRPKLSEVVAALERFMDVNAQETLRALRESLAKHGYTSSRYETK